MEGRVRMQLWTCPSCREIYQAGTRHTCIPEPVKPLPSEAIYFDRVEELIANLKTELLVDNESVQNIIIAKFLTGGRMDVILKDGELYTYSYIGPEGSRRWYRCVMGRNPYYDQP